jgi:hypothetical protein
MFTENFNSDIFIKKINREDFKHNMYVQSFGNKRHIYQLRFIDGEWCYAPTHIIKNRELDNSHLETYTQTELDFERKQKATGNWCQTIYTQELVAQERVQKIDSILN